MGKEIGGSGEPEIGGQPERRFPGSVGSVVSSGIVLVVITYGCFERAIGFYDFLGFDERFRSTFDRK